MCANKFRLPQKQKVFWSDWKRNPKNVSQNLCFEYRMDFDVEISSLIVALSDYVAKANSFCHSKYTMIDGEVYFEIDPTHSLNLQVDIGLLDGDDAQTKKEQFFFKPFDLEQGDVYRFLISKNKHSYSLLVAFHHIVLDTVSYTNFITHIADQYNANISGEVINHESVNDIETFLQREQANIAAAKPEKIIESFTADSLFVDIIPDRKASKSDQLAGRSIHFELADDLRDGLNEFINHKSTRSTFFRVSMAAYCAMLKFYSGQEHLSVVLPVSHRSVEMTAAHGAFITMLPLSIHLNDSMNTYDLVRHINYKIKETKSYKGLTYPALIAHMRQHDLIDSDEQNNVCISESLGLIRKEVPKFIGGETISLPIARFEPVYDLSLYCAAYEGKNYFQLDYDASKYTEEFMQQFVQQFLKVLAVMIDNPGQVLSRSILVEPGDYRLRLNIEHMLGDQGSSSVVDHLVNFARSMPDNIALKHYGQQLTYKQLDELTDHWAYNIQQQLLSTVEPKLIGVCFDRSIDLIVGIISILKASFAYVPLDPLYPKERLQYIINDSELATVLTNNAHASLFGDAPVNLVILDDTVDTKTGALKPEGEVQADDLAYIIYTSGSTGNPKGVKISHRNISRLFSSSEAHFDFSHADVWCLFHSVSFDFSVWEIWGALFYGGTLKIVPYTVSRDPREFYSWLQKEQVTVLNQTPSAFQKLVEQDQHSENHLTSLRYVVFGGEALKVKPLISWFAKYGATTPAMINMYGITETTVHVTYRRLSQDDIDSYQATNIGEPLTDLGVLIVDDKLQLCPPGVPGEMCVIGAGLASGYLHKPELTAERFIQNPHAEILGLDEGSLMYRSGDLARLTSEGSYEYIGRLDKQVKIRGFRIELGEIEAIIQSYSIIKDVVVLQDLNSSDSLLAYCVLKEGAYLDKDKIRAHVMGRLPKYMLPRDFIQLSKIPINHNGKLAYRDFDSYIIATEYAPSVNRVRHSDHLDLSDIKSSVSAIWQEVLNTSDFNHQDQFFNIGGDSFSILLVRDRLEVSFDIEISVDLLFKYTSIDSLSSFIASEVALELKEAKKTYALPVKQQNELIAIVGISCKVPSAHGPDKFWEMLVNGKSSIREFSDEEIQQHVQSGINVEANKFVKRGSVFDDVYEFDASFFGYTKKDAQLMDPQQRMFLSLAWETLEHSGNVPSKYKGTIGVFASQGKNFYALDRVYPQLQGSSLNDYQAMILNEKDFLSTKVSHQFNLTGPSINVQTGCSSSLVSIHLACQNLKNMDCDLALAGGVSIFYKYGYPYIEGMIESVDGYCRPFDAKAQGTVAGSGAGIVALKRLSDAICDGDQVYAVIAGSAINNDGSNKMSYTAPSVDGQIEVIRKAYEQAGVRPNQIGYIEAHGTATPLGDPIEVSALNQMFAADDQVQRPCILGSVKSNIGHTDAAAGVLGLIKAALSIHHGEIPGTLNFSRLNPEIARVNRHFAVSRSLTKWNSDSEDRYAAVSAFGIGGTNTHLVLRGHNSSVENLEQRQHDGETFVIPLSAKSHASLTQYAQRFAEFMTQKGQALNLKKIAFSMQEGRAVFAHRGYCVILSDAAAGNKLLASEMVSSDQSKSSSSYFIEIDPVCKRAHLHQLIALVNTLSGVGSDFDECLQILAREHNCSLSLDGVEMDSPTSRVCYFIVQYVLIKLLRSLNVKISGFITCGIPLLSVLAAYGLASVSSCLANILNEHQQSYKTDMLNLSSSDDPANILIYDVSSSSWVDLSSNSYAFVESLLGQKQNAVPNSKGSDQSVLNLTNLSLFHQKGGRGSIVSDIHLRWAKFIGELWINCGEIHWSALRNSNDLSQKCALPTYAFVTEHYEIDAPDDLQSSTEVPRTSSSKEEQDDIHGGLKKMWSQVLGVGVDQLGDDSHFFDLGGDSLALIDLSDKIQQSWGIDVGLEDIAENLQFNSMASMLGISGVG